MIQYLYSLASGITPLLFVAMTHRFSLTILGTMLCALIFLSGCANTDDVSQTTTSTMPVTVSSTLSTSSSTVALTLKQEAYAHCATRGYDTRLFYNDNTGEYELFCQFDATRECPAEAFLDQSCTPQNALSTSNVPQADGRVLSLRTCDSRTLPVCGIDGQTYINACIAQVSGITVASQGACATPVTLQPDDRVTERRQTSIRNYTRQAQERFTSSRSNTSGTNEEPPELPQTNEPYPSWVEVSATFLLQSGDPNARIEQCSVANETYYYQRSCPTCFSVLFDDEGDVACFPNNDITGECPEQIKKNTASCRVIWES